jgi:hypothetical protein
MIHIADYDFLTNDIQLPFKLGEKTLFNLNYKGFRCHIDIFRTPELSSPLPPFEEMKASGNSIALTISYPVARRMPKIAFRQGYICYTLKQYRRLYVDTNREFAQYLERFKGKTISTIKRKVKKVTDSNESGTSLKVFTTPEEITEFIGIAWEISKKTYQHRLLNQGLQVNERYMNDYLRKARENRIVGLILYAKDTPVAYNLCPIYGDGIMIYYWTGFNPEYNKYSPGTVLQYRTIETACGLDHVKYYDFCTGEGKHKELFTDVYKLCAEIFYFPLNPKYLFIVISNWIFDTLINIVRFLTRRLGIKDRIKKMVRAKAGKR